MTLSNDIPQIWGGNFTFTGSADLLTGTGSVTLNANPNINVAAHALTIGGAIGNGTGNSITKTGTGNLVLTGSLGSYTGNTTINGGTVFVASGTATGANNAFSVLGSTSSGTVTVASGALSTWPAPGAITRTKFIFGTKQFFISGSGVGGLGVIVNTGTTGSDSDGATKRPFEVNAACGFDRWRHWPMGSPQ